MNTTILVRAVAAAALLAAASAAQASDLGAEAPSTGAAAEAPLKIVVSLEAQELRLYRGAQLVDVTPVSTGKRGHRTPRGVYSVIEKRRRHFSNLYDNAPMPYMQRLTWSGIAFHEGHLPGRPASHGCIRMPKKFARKLFSLTSIGANVAITSAPAALTAIEHRLLTGLEGHGAGAPSELENPAEIQTAALTRGSTRGGGRLRVLITTHSPRDRVRLAQRMLAELGHYRSAIDGIVGPRTMRAIADFERAASADPEAGRVSRRTRADALSPEILRRLHAATGAPEESARVYVRRGYRDLFEAPALIRDADVPLGTHVFTALKGSAQPSAPRWTAVTVDPADGVSAMDALDRVEVDEATRARIAALLNVGATVIVSDAGASSETNRGTDFIVQP